ncbi:hypothetical protein NE236_05565 [Actinoallomurus purpureus]|uniref:hypothetical protein n=1 Tax=Actinoallomurus purpureus TaxID=478114 RepID=UPI0020923CB1|nr:hypothetical protein [Actinoallomurus purpureus]MCO6004445.1 hypothetical protein [Actinoallomurus purpureus]
MGSRVHYVVKKGGLWAQWYSQFGGYAMELDLLPGPQAATRFALGQQPVEWWLSELECEGAALIDHDEQRLLWQSDCDDDAAYQTAVLAVMAHTWPGWRIDWAHGGLGDILDALGEQRRFWESRRSSLQGDTGTQDGRLGRSTATSTSDSLRGLRDLVERFDAHQEMDEATQAISLLLRVTGALTALGEQSGLRVETPVDNSFAHRPMDLTKEERATAHAAFDAVRRRHESRGAHPE